MRGVIGGDKCVVGTGVEAAATGAALRRDGAVVTVELESGDEFADEAIGAVGGVDKEGVAANPAETRPSRPKLVGDGGGVDKRSCREVGVAFLDFGKELEEHLFDALVIVLPVGVLGNERRLSQGLRWFVGEEERDDGFGAGE